MWSSHTSGRTLCTGVEQDTGAHKTYFLCSVQTGRDRLGLQPGSASSQISVVSYYLSMGFLVRGPTLVLVGWGFWLLL